MPTISRPMVISDFPPPLFEAAVLDRRDFLAEEAIREALATLSGRDSGNPEIWDSSQRFMKKAREEFRLGSYDRDADFCSKVKDWLETLSSDQLKTIAKRASHFKNDASGMTMTTTAYSVVVLELQRLARESL
jgi:hypothetical protein